MFEVVRKQQTKVASFPQGTKAKFRWNSSIRAMAGDGNSDGRSGRSVLPIWTKMVGNGSRWSWERHLLWQVSWQSAFSMTLNLMWILIWCACFLQLIQFESFSSSYQSIHRIIQAKSGWFRLPILILVVLIWLVVWILVKWCQDPKNKMENYFFKNNLLQTKNVFNLLQ